MTTLHQSLAYQPNELTFGTSGLRALVSDMTDLECYINAVGFLHFAATQFNLESGATIYLGGDLRDSTPRIMAAMHQAITDCGYRTEYCGLIPTPTIAYYALQKGVPCIMVTGSHIPADRNGIKFYKADGEVLKEDEAPIKAAVAKIREELYSQDMEASAFTSEGALKTLPALPAEVTDARDAYCQRYQSVFSADALAGKKLVFYQHSAVGRDLLVELFKSFGAEVVTVGRSDMFVPIDTENVTTENQAYFRELAAEHPDCFAIVSTDGDSDRPFVIDQTGEFHRGDVLGALVAAWCGCDATAYPVSASDAADDYLASKNIAYEHTKIGSPYVVSAMSKALGEGKKCVGGWEVNGGFMLGNPFVFPGGTLQALPTRDAFFPILAALLCACEQNKSVQDIFKTLPARFTQAGMIDDFPTETSAKMVAKYGKNSPEVYAELARYFTPELGYGTITSINTIDGVRITFNNHDIADLRPSGNAPQLRIYSITGSQKRADEIVSQAIAEPDGIFRRIERDLE